MSVLVRNKNKTTNDLFVKGAPEYLLKNSKKILTKNGNVVDLS